MQQGSRRSQVVVTTLLLSALVSLTFTAAWAETGSGPRLLVFPLRGPGGQIVRNDIHSRLAKHYSVVGKASAGQARSPMRAAKRFGADALITGSILCPGRACVVEVVVSKRNGAVLAKNRRRTSRAGIGKTAGDLAVEIMQSLGVKGRPYQVEDEEFVFGPSDEEEMYSATPTETEPAPSDETDLYGGSNFDRAPEPTGRRHRHGEDEEEREDEELEPGEEGSNGHDFDAIEFYFTTDLTARRLICVDLDMPDYSEAGCDRQNPYWDDRAYSAGPFASLGARLAIFPGAFANRRRATAHLGLYFEYGRSVSLSSRRTFESSSDPPEDLDVIVDTVQQDIKAGLVYRVPMPFRSPAGPQFRFMAGFGYYEFSFDDSDWPSDDQISSRFRDSNPYLPSFRYLSFDAGFELRIPVRGFLFPYLSALYRATLDAGQADRIYGPDSTIHGVEGEIGLRIEPGAGVRLIVGVNVLWYLSTFNGDFAPENSEERLLWRTDAFSGDTANDIVIRIRMGLGWSY